MQHPTPSFMHRLWVPIEIGPRASVMGAAGKRGRQGAERGSGERGPVTLEGKATVYRARGKNGLWSARML